MIKTDTLTNLSALGDEILWHTEVDYFKKLRAGLIKDPNTSQEVMEYAQEIQKCITQGYITGAGASLETIIRGLQALDKGRKKNNKKETRE